MPRAPSPHIPFLESPLLARAGFRHAFFTRHGGVSAGVYASLNFSYTVGDERPNVDENFRRAAQVLGVERDSIHFLAQVHGDDVVNVSASTSRGASQRSSGDALISLDPREACAIRTADCVPLLIADTKSGAVAAVHAGWRGVVRGVVAATLRELDRLGAERDALLVAIGPHISLAAFEVGADVASELASASRATNAVESTAGAKLHVSLARILVAQLLEAGVDAARIDELGGCTVGEPQSFFSYRRDGPESGRLLSAIVPRQARPGTPAA